MPRTLHLAAAQLGPIERKEPRRAVVDRLRRLLREAASRGCGLVVFPEMALTTFFPRWEVADPRELDGYFETEMPGPETCALFEESSRLGVGFYLGYCELVREPGGSKRRFNTSVLVDSGGRIVGKYRKVHVPGTRDSVPGLPFQHLEKRYFEPGDLGFPVWEAFGTRVGMCICNDRRWPETYREMALAGAELVVLGYNSPSQLPDCPEQNHLRTFHHLLCMQAAAYQNGLWVVAAGKAGREGGVDMLGQSCVIAPSGEVVVMSSSLGDELVSYRFDPELAQAYKRFFGLEENRRPECYRRGAAPGAGPVRHPDHGGAGPASV